RDELAVQPPGTWAHNYLGLPRERGAVAVGSKAAAARQLALAPRHRDAFEGERRGRYGLVQLVDSVQQVAELEAPEHLLQLRTVRRREHELGRVGVELEVASHRRELLRCARLLGVLL